MPMLKRIHFHLHKHYHLKYFGVYAHAKQLFIFDMALLFLAVILFSGSAWLFFWKPGVADQVQIEISLGEIRRSGDEARILIDYTNHSKTTLTNASLALRLPKGFVVNDLKTPTPSFVNHSFKLADLAPGAHGRAEVVGTLWSDVGQEERIISTLSYKQQNKEREEQALGSYLLKLNDSVLSSKLNIATTSFPNNQLPFTYIIKNDSKQTITDISLKFEPTVSEKKIQNKIQSIGPGESLEIKGEIVSGVSNYNFQIIPSVAIHNNNFQQEPISSLISVYAPKIGLKATLEKEVKMIEPKGEIPLKISWSNESIYSLSNQKILLTFPNGVVDLNKSASENGLRRENNSLIIDSRYKTFLTNGSAGAREEITLNLYLLPSFRNKPDEVSNLSINPVFQAELSSVPNQTFSASGNSIVMPLLTEIELNNSVRYYTDEGDQLGRGPLPPKVGQTTRYWVFTALFNSTNGVRNPSLKINLAPGAQFTGRQSVTLGPELKYDSKTNTLSWSHDYIPSYTQTGFYFEISVKPTPEQVGKTINLISGANFSAVDDRVEKELNTSSGVLNNILPSGDKGAGKGAAVGL